MCIWLACILVWYAFYFCRLFLPVFLDDDPLRVPVYIRALLLFPSALGCTHRLPSFPVLHMLLYNGLCVRYYRLICHARRSHPHALVCCVSMSRLHYGAASFFAEESTATTDQMSNKATSARWPEVNPSTPMHSHIICCTYPQPVYHLHLLFPYCRLMYFPTHTHTFTHTHICICILPAFIPTYVRTPFFVAACCLLLRYRQHRGRSKTPRLADQKANISDHMRAYMDRRVASDGRTYPEDIPFTQPVRRAKKTTAGRKGDSRASHNRLMKEKVGK